ncbi:MAG: ABC transporter substrate-binding protein [Acidobacteriaceae bacterium]|nr:ABC transporter substrate-binding protein [Acidobacteriaceae bacterium]
MSTPLEIVCAHSPDSDDAFMFYGLATKKIRSRIVSFRHVLEDIESLNRKATEGLYELTAISYHAYPYVADKYVLMASGSSVGDGYGPMVVSTRPFGPDELKGKKIAIPGTMTTAFLTLKLFQPDFEQVVIPFDKIIEAVKDHEVDAGLIIHEGQLTYGHGGLHSVLDLGKWFRSKYDLPLPLGANALRRNLAPDVRAECSRLMKESIQYSLDHREQALNYAMQFARDLDTALAEQFVGMYVNHFTIDGGDIVPRAAQKLLDLGFEAGLIPHKTTVEVAR